MALQEGDRFADFRAFKTAMQDWGLKGQIKFNFRYQKSDSIRKIVVCAHAGCPFRIYGVLSDNKEYVSVTTVVDEHTYVGAPSVKRGLATQQWWLQEILPTVVTVSKTTTPKQIIDAMCYTTKLLSAIRLRKKQRVLSLVTTYNNKATSSDFFLRTSMLSVKLIPMHTYIFKLESTRLSSGFRGDSSALQ
jgi:hypothetical protein